MTNTYSLSRRHLTLLIFLVVGCLPPSTYKSPSTVTNTPTLLPATLDATPLFTTTPKAVAQKYEGLIVMSGVSRLYTGIRILDIESSKIIEVTSMGSDSVSWSPNGEKIAFSGGIPGTQRKPNIFVVSINDNKILRLTDSPASQNYLGWSPDGNKIVFEFSHDINQLDLATINLENNKTETFTFTAGDEHHPAWSPDGNEIAYLYFDSSSSSKASQLWVMDCESKTSNKILDAEVAYSNIDWSPNGEWIAYIDTKEKSNCGDIYLIRPDGSDKSRIMELPSCASSLSWSPNGEFIAFTSKDVETDYWGIYILDIKAKIINKIYSEEKDVIKGIDWSMP